MPTENIKLRVIFAFLLFNLYLGVNSANACLCSRGWTIELGFEKADVVVEGTVLNYQKKFIPSQEDPQIGRFSVNVMILVETMFKGGTIQDTLIVETGGEAGECGVDFEEGAKYIIYALKNQRSSSNEYLTNICLGTQIADKSHLRKLERLQTAYMKGR